MAAGSDRRAPAGRRRSVVAAGDNTDSPGGAVRVVKRSVALLLAGIAAAACVSTPPAAPGQVAVQPAALGLVAAPPLAISSTWWTAFGDSQLDDLVAQALAGNPSLQVALARMRQAQAGLESVRGSTYAQFGGDADVRRQRLSESYIIPPPWSGTTQSIATAQATLSWSLDFWGRQQLQVDQAHALAAAAALDADAARLALAGSVTQAYIGLARAWSLRDLAADAVKQREGVLALTATRVTSGLESQAAARQAEALLALERENLAGAAADVELAEHGIATLAGRGVDLYGQIARPQLQPDALALPDSLPADLLARRPDIRAARARIDAAMAGREVARKAWYPDIDLAGFAGIATIGLSSLFSTEALTYGAGAAIHLPMFNVSQLRATYAGATADLDAAVADYNAGVVGAVRQAADAVTRVRSLQEQAHAQGAALTAAEASLRLAQSRYRNGLSPQLAVLDAEAVWLRAKHQQVLVHSELVDQRIALLVALGGGFAADTPTGATAASSSQGMAHE